METLTPTPTAHTPPRTQQPPLPGAGPAWYGSVMGTGILSTLTEKISGQVPVGHGAAVVLCALSWALLVGITVGFAVRIVRRPRVFIDSLTDGAVAPMWGMVSMGILSVGSATLTVAPAGDAGFTRSAGLLDGLLWSIGTFIGIVSAVGFGARLIGSDIGAPTTVWGLAVVAPMVSATTGAALVPTIDGVGAQLWLLTGVSACFFLSLFVGAIVFITAYHHHWTVRGIPLAASASAWIPLGMVGQSTAAAQSIATQSKQFVIPGAAEAVQAAANTYGFVMLALGIPLICWAVLVTTRGFAGRMPFTPGWWAMTFPIGTLSLGTYLLGTGSGLAFFHVVGVGLCLVLVCTWLLCSASSVKAIRREMAH